MPGLVPGIPITEASEATPFFERAMPGHDGGKRLRRES
jgi:hypothetical protein